MGTSEFARTARTYIYPPFDREPPEELHPVFVPLVSNASRHNEGVAVGTRSVGRVRVEEELQRAELDVVLFLWSSPPALASVQDQRMRDGEWVGNQNVPELSDAEDDAVPPFERQRGERDGVARWIHRSRDLEPLRWSPFHQLSRVNLSIPFAFPNPRPVLQPHT